MGWRETRAAAQAICDFCRSAPQCSGMCMKGIAMCDGCNAPGHKDKSEAERAIICAAEAKRARKNAHRAAVAAKADARA